MAAETSGARDCCSIQAGELLPGEHQPGVGGVMSPLLGPVHGLAHTQYEGEKIQLTKFNWALSTA